MASVWTRSWRCLQLLVKSPRAVFWRDREWFSIWSKSGVWRKLSLRRILEVAKTFTTVKVKAPRRQPFILYGMAAFLWEREKIPEEEVQRCLRYYEERVKAGSDKRALSLTPSPSNAVSTSTSWFSWLTGQSQETASIEPAVKPPKDERELKRQQFVAELTAMYSERSQEQMSKYPLIGMQKKVPIGYKIGSTVIGKTRASVASLVKHAAALTQTTVNESKSSDFKPVSLSCCEVVSDLACLGVELHHHRLAGDWVPVSMDAELTNQFQTSGYPLVGLQKRNSRVSEKLSQVNLPSLHNSLENFVHSFDQVVGMDSVLDHSVAHQANAILKSLFQRTLRIVDRFIQVEHSLTDIGLNDNFNFPSSEQMSPVSSDHLLSDWELFLNESSYLVYRKPYANTGLYQFKVIGSYRDVTAKDFYEVQVNEEMRMSWDHYVTKLKTVDSDPTSGCEVVHWVMKFPFPMSRREYVYVHKSWVSPREDAIVFVNKSVTHPSVPEFGNAVRVKDYYSEMVIKAHTSVSEPGLDYELTYFDDPQVHLPSSCVNWVANSAMPEFLRKVHNAALSKQNTMGQLLAT